MKSMSDSDPGREPRAAHEGRPRDPWRVEGSRRREQQGPSGGRPRGASGGQPPAPRQGSMRWFWLLFATLLIVNWVIAASLTKTKTTTTLSLPYSVFYGQVVDNNVASITSTGSAIQGTLREAVTYPEGKTGESAKEFKTYRPQFVNDNLGDLLVTNKVLFAANPSSSATPVWEELLVGFGPTLLLFGLLFLIFRGASRSLAGGAGSFAGFGKARARRYEPSEQRTTFADVAGIDEATEELAEVVDFLKNPIATSGSGGWCRAACCSPANRGPARRCWRARSRAKPTRRSSRCRLRSSSR